MAERGSRSTWERRVARWERSGLSRAAFARREGVNARTLGWWRWKLASETSAFIEVSVQAAEPLAVELANGRTVRVPSGFDEETLARVIAVAEAA